MPIILDREYAVAHQHVSSWAPLQKGLALFAASFIIVLGYLFANRTIYSYNDCVEILDGSNRVMYYRVIGASKHTYSAAIYAPGAYGTIAYYIKDDPKVNKRMLNSGKLVDKEKCGHYNSGRGGH
jgi:hypothetical protein